MARALLKIFNVAWVGGWLTFFVWYTKDALPKLPTWLQIAVVVLVLGFSTIWLMLVFEADSRRR